MKDACSLVCSFVRSGSRSFAPTVHSCLRRRAQTPSRSAVAQTTPQCPTSRGRTLDGGEHGGRLAWVGQKTIRRSGTAKLEPAMLSPPSQLCAHGCIVPSSRSGLLYNVREWERERPSNAVTAAPSNCVNGLTPGRARPLFSDHLSWSARPASCTGGRKQVPECRLCLYFGQPALIARPRGSVDGQKSLG